MKKLISAKSIEQAYANGNLQLVVNLSESIVTPQAQTRAEQLGVQIVEQKVRTKISYTDFQKIVEMVSRHFAGSKFSRAKIEKAVKEILDAGY